MRRSRQRNGNADYYWEKFRNLRNSLAIRTIFSNSNRCDFDWVPHFFLRLSNYHLPTLPHRKHGEQQTISKVLLNFPNCVVLQIHEQIRCGNKNRSLSIFECGFRKYNCVAYTCLPVSGCKVWSAGVSENTHFQVKPDVSASQHMRCRSVAAKSNIH